MLKLELKYNGKDFSAEDFVQDLCAKSAEATLDKISSKFPRPYTNEERSFLISELATIIRDGKKAEIVYKDDQFSVVEYK